MTKRPDVEAPESVQFASNPHERNLGELLGANLNAMSVATQMLVAPWLPASILRGIATRRLRRLLGHARQNVPYYRKALEHIDPSSIELDGLANVPLLDKGVMRDHGDTLLTEGADVSRLQRRGSSGSSGVPVSVYFDPIAELPRRLQELRFLFAHGFRPWHKQLIFDALAHASPVKFWPQRLGFWRREFFPSWLEFDEALRYVDDLRPEYVHGVLTEIKMVALEVAARGGFSFKPRLVITKGELLTEATRDLIEEAMGARVADYYATEEVGIIAWQCSERNYHVDQDFVHLEIVDEDGKPLPYDTPGEILITNLYQQTMPMIRFRTGDLGTLSSAPCPCGRRLPVLRELRGRKLDCIVTPRGDLHEPFRIVAVVEKVESIRQFRIHQTAIDHIKVEVNWEEGTSTQEEDCKEITRLVQGVTGPEVEVVVEEVPSFARGFAKKFHLVKGLGDKAIQDLRARGELNIRLLDSDYR